MPLLFDEDYATIKDWGLEYEEDEKARFLVIKNFPAPVNIYVSRDVEGKEVKVENVEVLWLIPSDYNTSGGDMFWFHPAITRKDGQSIPGAAGFGGGDSRFHNGKEYCRWSRHFAGNTWTPKVDNILKVLSRIEWVLKNPDTKR